MRILKISVLSQIKINSVVQELSECLCLCHSSYILPIGKVINVYFVLQFLSFVAGYAIIISYVGVKNDRKFRLMRNTVNPPI